MSLEPLGLWLGQVLKSACPGLGQRRGHLGLFSREVEEVSVQPALSAVGPGL